MENELAKNLAGILKQMSPADLAATQTTLQAELSARGPAAVNVDDILPGMADEQRQQAVSQIVQMLRDTSR
jgi:hypothetical protein